MSQFESSYKKIIRQKVDDMFRGKDEELKALVLAHELHTDPKEREKAVEETLREIAQSQRDMYNELVELGFITSPENVTTVEKQ
jgi:hypothetical protein